MRNKNQQIHIGLLTLEDAKDKHLWSGILYQYSTVGAERLSAFGRTDGLTTAVASADLQLKRITTYR